MIEKLKLARADGSYPKFLDQIAKYKLLILDDWLRNHLTETQTNDILDSFRPLGGIMKSQCRFAPKGDRNESESVACLAGISISKTRFS